MIIGATSVIDSNPYAPAKPQSLTDSVVEQEELNEFMGSEVAEQLRLAEVDPEIAYGIDAPPIGIDEMAVTNTGLLSDGNWYEASKIVHDYQSKINAYESRPPDLRDRTLSILAGPADPSGAAMTDRELAKTLDATEIAEFGLEYAGSLNHNLTNGLINWSKVDEMPQEVAIAQAAMLEMYEKLPPVSWPGTKRFLKNLPLDITNAASLGSLAVVKQLLQQGGKAAVRKRLMQVALGSSAVGVEGSAYAALSEYINQRLRFQPPDADERRGMDYPGEERTFQPDWNNISQSAALGFALTAGITGAATQAGPIARGVRRVYDAGRAAAGRAVYGDYGGGAVLRSGIGPLPENPNRAGTQLAQQPDAMGFRSGLINMLDALPESATGEQMLATLSDPQRLAEFGAKAEEISLTGLDKYLREAEGPVTKSDIAAHLEANRVELGEARNTGSSNYFAGEYNTYTPEAYDFDDLISSRDADEYEFSRGYISGFNEGDDEDIVDVMITKQFDIFDPEKNKSVLDEIELSMNNNSSYFDDEEGEAAREAATEIIGQIRNKIRGGVGDLPSSIKNQISELYEDLNANLFGGEVFEAMESRASYDVFDPRDYHSVGKFDSEDEAVHRATEYIESLDVDPDAGPGGRFSSITFPTNDGSRPENYKEVRLLMPEDDTRFPYVGDVNQHFEQNTFAHYRSTDRQVVFDQPDQPDMFGGADPKDVMFVEEIQSDLMQAGGKRGYKTAEITTANIDALRNDVQSRLEEKLRAFGYGGNLDESDPLSEYNIVRDYAGLFEGFSRMMRGKNRVEEMNKFLDDKYEPKATIHGDDEMAAMISRNMRQTASGLSRSEDYAQVMDAVGRIKEMVAELPKKLKDDKLYDAFLEFVGHLDNIQGGNEIGGAVRALSPKRYDKGSRRLDKERHQLGREFLEKLDAKDLRDFFKARDMRAIYAEGLPDIPLRKDWVELTMKRAIYDAIEEGKTMIAFPNHAETVGAIEYDGRPATGAIARLYEKEIPKILQKLAKQTGGEIRTGSIAESIKHRADDRFMQGEDTLDDALYQDQGSVIILDLSKNPQKVKREGFAIPAIAGGATALTAAQQMQQQEQPQQ